MIELSYAVFGPYYCCYQYRVYSIAYNKEFTLRASAGLKMFAVNVVKHSTVPVEPVARAAPV